MKRIQLTLAAMAAGLVLALTPTGSDAATQLGGRTYHFGTHEARTNVTFVSEADLETIHGVTHKLQGSVRIDGSGQRVSTGTLKIGVRALDTGIALRDEHLRSDTWLDARRFPWITLAIKSAVEGKDGRTWDWTGDLTIKGVTRRVRGKARIRTIPDGIGKQLGDGSWVRVRTSFDVDITKYGVRVPQNVAAKVETVWKIGVDVYGTTAAPRRR